MQFLSARVCETRRSRHIECSSCLHEFVEHGDSRHFEYMRNIIRCCYWENDVTMGRNQEIECYYTYGGQMLLSYYPVLVCTSVWNTKTHRIHDEHYPLLLHRLQFLSARVCGTRRIRHIECSSCLHEFVEHEDSRHIECSSCLHEFVEHEEADTSNAVLVCTSLWNTEIADTSNTWWTLSVAVTERMICHNGQKPGNWMLLYISFLTCQLFVDIVLFALPVISHPLFSHFFPI